MRSLRSNPSRDLRVRAQRKSRRQSKALQRLSLPHGRCNGPSPPSILWRHTVKEAARRTAKGLAADDLVRSDTRSWTEVPFGPNRSGSGTSAMERNVGGSDRADRLGLRRPDGSSRYSRDRRRREDHRLQEHQAASKKPNALRLDKDASCSACFTAIAVRALLPEVRTVVARLIYTGG